MNTILLKESDLEINAYLDSLSLHQSFEEDDTEDDEFFTVNPSGSVLQPASNPYNKQKKIAEANETLFAEEVVPKSPQKVKFNKVEKRICYDYLGSSFESDSIKSYEDEESEKESLLQTTEKQTIEPILDLNGTHLLPQHPANKVVVTVTPKKEDEQDLSESESEDVCVGKITKTEEPVVITKVYEEVQNIAISEQSEDNTRVIKKDKDSISRIEGSKIFSVDTNEEEINQLSMDEKSTNTFVNIKSSGVGDEDNNVVGLPIDLDRNSQKYPNGFNNNIDFYPCSANHSGITIRITGADSIESVESESTDNEIQLMDNYNNHHIIELKKDHSSPLSKAKNLNNKTKESKSKVSKQPLILKSYRTSQNTNLPKSNKNFEMGPLQRTCSKKGGRDKLFNVSKQNLMVDKTEQSSSTKVEKHSSKMKTNSKNMSFKSKSLESKLSSMTDDCLSCTKRVRPKSCVEKESVKIKTSSRPVTAPVKRSCCPWGQPHLPEYNGLRSEYGLSAEQLTERKRHRMEAQKVQKQRKEQKYMEDQQKKKENEATFVAWLENKRKQAQMQFLRNQKLQEESGIKIYPAPTSHLKRTGAVRSRKLFKSQRKCVSLEELLNNASTHEKNTYRIYLGLSFE